MVPAAVATADAQAAAAFPTALLWSAEIPAAPASPPVVGGRRVVVATREGTVLAKDLIDGKDAWSRDIRATGPLAADDEVVLVPAEGVVYALSIETGERRWSVETATVTAPPLLKGGWVILATGEVLSAFSAAGGDEIWTVKIALVEQRPAIDGNHLYVSIADGRVIALDLESGTLRWEARIGANPTEPFAYGERVYVGIRGTHFACLKASDGKEDWTQAVGAAIRGTAAADAEHVYTASMDNLLRAFARGNGSLEWKADIGYRPLAGPILAGGRLAVPGRTATVRVFTTAGGRADALTLPDPAVAAPAFARANAVRPATVARGDGGTEKHPPGQPVLAFVTGDPGKPWLLSLAGPPPPGVPAPAPLSVLPGEALPPIALPGK